MSNSREGVLAQDRYTNREEAIQKLRDLMKGIKFCMLTTVDDDGFPRSRPMALQQTEFDGTLWFFTGKSTEKSSQIKHDQHVNITFADPGDHEYVSASGRAQLVDDRKKAEELWNPFYKAWFPQGVDDPDLTLIKVEIEQAEYWDSPNGAVTYLFGLVKAMATGQRATGIGDHEKLQLR